MTDMGDFPGFEEKVGVFLSGELDVDDSPEFKRLLCSDCDFFTPGEDEDMECACFHIMELLIRRGYLTLEQLSDALKD